MIDYSVGGGLERSLRELDFQPNDRVPIVGGFICKASFLEKVAGRGPFWHDPRSIAIEAYRRLGTDLIMQFVLPKTEEQMTESILPTNFSKGERPAYSSAEEVCASINEFPSVSTLKKEFDSRATEQNFREVLINGQEEMEDMLWIPYSGTACRFMWYSTYGFRPYFLAVMKYPDCVRRLYEYSGEEARLKNEALARVIAENDLPPYTYFGEDICYNRGPMVPVRTLREIYFPYLRRAIEPLKDADIKIIWHSDGNIMPILEDLLDCGVDGFQGFQQETGPTLEKLATMKSRAGRKLLLWGSVSVTSTLPFGSTADVEREVEACIDAAQEGGGFFIAPSSSVGPEVADENILAMYRRAIEYGTEIRA